MILTNTKGEGYAAYNPTYVSMAYKFPMPQTYLNESWLKELNLDMVETVKKMMIPSKNFVRGLPESTRHQPYVLHTGSLL